MEVTPSGIVTDVKLEQPQNAETPIDVTLEGIVTEVKPLQSLNAEFPIKVTPSGITNVFNLLADIPDGNHAAVNVVGETPENAEFPIFVTLEGIVTEVKLEQP